MASDWDEYTLRKPFEPEDKDKPYFFGSSLDFKDLLHEEMPHLIVPEREAVPLDGAIGWTPNHEDAAAAMCAFCLVPLTERNKGNAALLFHRIKPAPRYDGTLAPERETVNDPTCPLCRGLDAMSRLYCPKCQGSGFDRKLHRQLAVAGIPAPERPDPQDRRSGSTPDGASRQSPPPTNDASPAQDRPQTRRERRAQQFGRSDRPGAHDGRDDAPDDAPDAPGEPAEPSGRDGEA